MCSLIEETVREAEERVAQVDVSRAFDWSCLRRMTWRPSVWSSARSSCRRRFTSSTTRGDLVDDYLPRFRETATIWTKRNLFLSDVIWPRKWAFLDVLDFPAKGELRVGRDAASPRLRFKAHRWMIADAARTQGWRPMVWSDLRPGLLGEAPPELPAGSSWPHRHPGRSDPRLESPAAAPVIAPLPAACAPPHDQDAR